MSIDELMTSGGLVATVIAGLKLWERIGPWLTRLLPGVKNKDTTESECLRLLRQQREELASLTNAVKELTGCTGCDQARAIEHIESRVERNGNKIEILLDRTK